MNSRWQANKIGLINFWYYDEQEFPFVKGRMLLRGSNGSGKSVTMQSVVPLLLDGNMSPERLDPFGSRDRKMSSYLLEDDDGREERTGYLYMEFKRSESETYITIGMGIRARRGRPLDKWYFGLTDGRRIGKDFYLYKQTGEKITLSRKELENRIQTGGFVFDRQSDYMEFVNRQIFGFESIEEYKEMIDLLIQLRTPKLSKDFKPSVVNDILSDSLQPLSDEELRPMSEAIENMDTMNMNLRARQESRQAAGKINAVLDKYNKMLLFGKAERCVENQRVLENALREKSEMEAQIEECEKRSEELEQIRIELDARKTAMEKERESLSRSDAVALKTRELELSERISEEKKTLEEKKLQLEGKQQQFIETENKLKDEQDKKWQKEKEIEALISDMEWESEHMGFDEHTFFSSELKAKLNVRFEFETHESQLRQNRKRIAEGLSILQEADRKQKNADDVMQKKDKNQRESDAAQIRVNELETVFIQVMNEWKASVYSWNGNNGELVLPEESVREMIKYTENYSEKSDFAMVRNIAADVFIRRKGELSEELRNTRLKTDELQEECSDQKKMLAEWENHKDPEPPRSEETLKNRERLKNMGVPYQEFYRIMEFGPSMDKASCDRLEEALMKMGILDALVIEEQYREQVLTMTAGCSDRYLFMQQEKAEHSLLDVLELNDEVNDILVNHRLTTILENIAYDGAGNTSVSPDGVYRIGVLTGTITGEHEAGFLGAKAREQNRQAQISLCRNEIARLESELEILYSSAAEAEKRIEILSEEYSNLPEDEDMREAYLMLDDAMRTAERLKTEGDVLAQQLQELTEAIRDIRKAAVIIADKLGLSCSLEVFVKAEEAAGDYDRHFSQLKAAHELYLQILSHLSELEERMDSLEEDMDQIRYDAGSTERALKIDSEAYASVQEQFRLTDYEEIKERLDICMQWLGNYPEKLRKCAEEKAQKSEQARNLREKTVQADTRIEAYKAKNGFLIKCYEAERALDYVKFSDEMSDTAAAVARYLEPECSALDYDRIIKDLNEVYFANQSFLNDYHLMQTEIFDELDKLKKDDYPAARRYDFQAHYQGVKIPFCRLIECLDEEIAELRELIKAGDRELFEDILANTVSRKIRGKINSSAAWVEKMNTLMGAMNTSSGLKLSLRWRSKTAETEDQLDTRELVELLKKDYRLMKEDEAERLSLHFRSKVEEARRNAEDSGGMVSFYQVMKETLDYRKWFEFQLFSQKTGERQKELTNSVFGTFSGGEKAMAMYVPLFSAVAAKYQGGSSDAPCLISLDEAFAGVDNRNIRDMFRLMAEFKFDFIINSQVLWGDCDTLDALAIYQLIRPENARFVTVMPYIWNGNVREMLQNEQEVEQRASAIAE